MRTPTPFVLDPGLSRLQASIPDLTEGLLPDAPIEGSGVQAAVSLVLRSGPDPEILLIRRAEAEGDPWSGHMALPGGRRDPADTSLLETAIRETREETGVELESQGVPFGRLEELTPATRRLPPIAIFPFVFGVPAGTSAIVSSREVDEVLWTPLAELKDPRSSGSVEILLGDTEKTFPCLRVGERVIWGLTYRILKSFFRLTQTEPTEPRS